MKKLLYLFTLIGLCLCACNKQEERKLKNLYYCQSVNFNIYNGKTQIVYYVEGGTKEWNGYVDEWVLREWNQHLFLEYTNNYYVVMYGVSK